MEMSPEQWELVKDLYEAALECDPTKRAEFVQQNTSDEVVRAEAMRLLAAHPNVGSFLSTPPFADDRFPAEQPVKRFATGEILAERFRIAKFIAAGGMGEVYEAEDLALKENLAIKTVRPEILQQKNALDRFKREVQLARRVTHPNICRVFDLVWHKRIEGEEESVIVFVTMELLQGETLSERIRRVGRFTSEEALPLIHQIASGLEAAHRAGVVHRDLKPGNVILVPDREEAQVRGVITDFGLAFHTGLDSNQRVDLTGTQGLFGTPAYMAPEQIEGKEVTKQVDIYALGLIIYEMVTGEHAFPADTPLASAAKRLSDPIVSPKRFVPELSDAWEQTIIRCLECDPGARYSSAMDVAKALSSQTTDSFNAALLQGSPPASGPGFSAVPLRRGSLALRMGALFFICLILALGLSRWHKHPSTAVSVSQPVHKAITFIGNAESPAISPDGKFVVYVVGRHAGKERLILQNLSGGPSLELLKEAGLGNPIWSPDGSEIMVLIWKDATEHPSLFVVSNLGGAPRPVGTNLDGLCWSPDGSQIVASATDAEAGIWSLNKQSGEKKQITAPKYQWLHDIDWSAKTNMLLLHTETSKKHQLWTMKPDGSGQRKLIEEEKGMSSPRWSPTENAIYYFRDEGNTTDLVKLRISGLSTESSVLASGLEAGDKFTLSADATQLAYTRVQQIANLWLAELPVDGTLTRVNEKALTSGTLFNWYPSISPDGRWVVFVSGSAAKSNLYKMSIDGGRPIQLTFFDTAESTSPAWSSDGKQIAFISNQGGVTKVWLVNADGGSARPLDKTNASDTNNWLSWFPSPEIVYQQPGLHNLRRLSIETQKEEPVFPVDSKGWLISMPSFSPDGKKFAIFWNHPDGEGLWLVDLEDHSERRLYAKSYLGMGWSSDGKSVYAGQWFQREIVQIGIEKPSELRSSVELQGGFAAGSVSPDGRKLILSIFESKSDVWLMKNFDPQAQGQK